MNTLALVRLNAVTKYFTTLIIYFLHQFRFSISFVFITSLLFLVCNVSMLGISLIFNL